MRHVIPFRLIESRSGGACWELAIIDAGFSKNWEPTAGGGGPAPRYYEPRALREAAPLFEGRPICAIKYAPSGGEPLHDHVPDHIRQLAPYGFTGNVIGILSGVRYDESRKALVALAHITCPQHQRLLEVAHAHGSQLGFSIDATGRGTLGTREGRRAHVVEEIGHVDSLDLVTHPAAGGRLLRLVASLGGTMFRNILLKLAKRRPALCAGFTTEGWAQLSESAAKDQLTMLVQARETATKAALRESRPTTKRYAEAAVDSAMLAEIRDMLSAGDSAGALARLDELLAEDAMGAPGETPPVPAPSPLQESVVREARMSRVDRVLARFPSLPAASAARLRESYSAQAGMPEEKAIETAVQGELDYIGKVSPMLPGGHTRVTEGTDERKRYHAAFRGMLAGKDIDNVPRFRGLHESHRVIFGVAASPLEIAETLMRGAAVGLPSRPPGRRWGEDKDAGYKAHHQRVRESLPSHMRLQEAVSTSTWAEVYGDSMRRQLLDQYQDQYGSKQVPDHRPLVHEVSIPDFRTNRRVRVGGFGDLTTVAENAPYSEITDPGDQESTYAAAKRGNLFTLTMEALVNDDLGAMQRIPAMLGRAAARTLSKFFFLTNLASNPTLTADSIALIDAAHSNHQTAALSHDSLQTARQQMRLQTELSSGERFGGMMPKFLVVPAELFGAAYDLTKSTSKVTSGAFSTLPNQWADIYQLEAIENIWQTDATDWQLLAPPQPGAGFELGFVDGRSEPELFVADAENIGAMLTKDVVTHKIRHMYGGAWTDFRGVQGSIVA